MQPIMQSRNRRKSQLNRRARNANFEPGDAVFYLDPTVRSGLSSKLSMRWNPYYRVVEQSRIFFSSFWTTCASNEQHHGPIAAWVRT